MPTLDGDAIAFHGDDAFDVVELVLLRVQVDHDLAATWRTGAIVACVSEKIFAHPQRGFHAGRHGIQHQELARRLGMDGIDAGCREHQAGDHESAGVDGPSFSARMRVIAHPVSAPNRIDHDVQPQPGQQREADGKHPETRQHTHHGEHQQGVRDHDEDEQRDAAPRLTDINVTQSGCEHRQQRRHPRRGAPSLVREIVRFGRSEIGNRCHQLLRTGRTPARLLVSPSMD